MPKRSKEDTEITIQKIMDAVIDQLITLGYDKMSYTTLSQQTGVSRTGISHHFPKKTDFTAALGDRIYNMFIKHLECNKTVSDFSLSWLDSLNNREFVALLRLLFLHIVSMDTSREFAERGVERLYNLVNTRFGKESQKELEWLVGHSLMTMSH